MDVGETLRRRQQQLFQPLVQVWHLTAVLEQQLECTLSNCANKALSMSDTSGAQLGWWVCTCMKRGIQVNLLVQFWHAVSQAYLFFNTFLLAPDKSHAPWRTTLSRSSMLTFDQALYMPVTGLNTYPGWCPGF